MRVAREPQFAPIYETLKYGIIGEHLADHFGTEGSPISLTTACASGATAIAPLKFFGEQPSSMSSGRALIVEDRPDGAAVGDAAGFDGGLDGR